MKLLMYSALPDDIFLKMTTQFRSRIEYYDAVVQAEHYVLQGMDIPKNLKARIDATRNDYRYLDRKS